MTIPFTENATPTIGVEVEMQLVDPRTLQLTPGIEELTRLTPEEFRESVKKELMQSYVEVNTGVCADTREVRQDLSFKMRTLCHATQQAGLLVLWAGTHPQSRWDKQIVTNDPRYHKLIDQLQYVARRLVTFGVHVHIGMPGGEAAIAVMNDIARYVPYFVALSANSPFWYGKPSGLQSSRVKALEALPRGGLPPELTGWTEFQHLFDTLKGAGAIDTIKELWWDIRPHPDFGTLEIRAFDTPLTFDEVISMAALVQTLVVRALDRRKAGTRPDRVHPTIVAQNKWWATRYGLDAELIDYEKGSCGPARAAIADLVRGLADFARDLGCLDDLLAIEKTLERGTGATLQMQVFDRTGRTADVARFLLDQNVCGRVAGEPCPLAGVRAAGVLRCEV